MKLKLLKLKEVKKFTIFLGDCNTILDNTENKKTEKQQRYRKSKHQPSESN